MPDTRKHNYDKGDGSYYEEKQRQKEAEMTQQEKEEMEALRALIEKKLKNNDEGDE